MTNRHSLPPLDYSQPYPSRRIPAMGRAAIATSHHLASIAGMDMLAKGGNAVDAAIAAAMVLTVVEPTGCGIGGDGFAILWDGKELHGLNGSGRSPAAWTPEYFKELKAVPERGWDSVTVPGVVSCWITLWERFGSLPLETLASPAIRHARDGFLVTPTIAGLWALGGQKLKSQPGFAECFLQGGRAPRAGELFRSPAHAATLEAIAATRGEAFYRGALAERIVADAQAHGAALSMADLGEHRAEWVGTISQRFANGVVHELPPANQGLATLIGLGILEAAGWQPSSTDDPHQLHLAIEATKLALADVYRHLTDVDAMRIAPEAFLDPAYLRERAKLIDPDRAGDPGHGKPRPGGTVCLAAADDSGMMVSFIQSNYKGFGSGVVVPDTGIALQNRGVGFTLEPGHVNQVAPRKRPFHTIIPGFAMDLNGEPLMAFGLMGGPIQAQGHLQLALRILGYGQNPQAAADAPRWRIDAGRRVGIEPGTDPALIDYLRARGHDIVSEELDATFSFGGAQIVLKTDGGYVAGSDPRKDGQALAR
ncbi:gamma-glutamyltransferase family protein [Rhizorhabdus dicambivorans]|nr:gamma-glutamyltransferase family protein [Rhizorhabdus dicambivorans]